MDQLQFESDVKPVVLSIVIECKFFANQMNDYALIWPECWVSNYCRNQIGIQSRVVACMYNADFFSPLFKCVDGNKDSLNYRDKNICTNLVLSFTLYSYDPHSACAAFTHGVIHKWNVLLWTVQFIGHLLQLLKDVIHQFLILGRGPCPELERELTSLLCWMGGLNVPNPTKKQWCAVFWIKCNNLKIFTFSIQHLLILISTGLNIGIYHLWLVLLGSLITANCRSEHHEMLLPVVDYSGGGLLFEKAKIPGCPKFEVWLAVIWCFKSWRSNLYSA